MKIKKQENKIVIFDWGGVVQSNREGEYNIYEARKNVIKKFNNSINENEILKKYQNCYTELNIRATKKEEDIKKWFYILKNDLELNCNYEEFCEVYEKENSKVYYYKNVVEFAHSLREHCKIGILSNLIYLDKKGIHNHMNFEKFDYVWLSFEIGAGKPEEKIYEFVENECKILPNNILFIDDKERNIVAAKQRGWNVCQARGYELDKIKASVEGFLNN